MLNNFTANELNMMINATTAPDAQLANKDLVPQGTVIEVTHIIQNEVVASRSGKNAICTTIVGADGKSYQTLSDFVAKFFMNIATLKPVDTWKNNPVKIMVDWRRSSRNDWLAIKLVD